MKSLAKLRDYFPKTFYEQVKVDNRVRVNLVQAKAHRLGFLSIAVPRAAVGFAKMPAPIVVSAAASSVVMQRGHRA